MSTDGMNPFMNNSTYSTRPIVKAMTLYIDKNMLVVPFNTNNH
jgi:hypothetical protein